MLLLCLATQLCAQLADHDVYNLGNLCDVRDLDPIINSLDQQLSRNQNESTIILNGDLTSYPISTARGKVQLENVQKLYKHFGNRKKVKVVTITGDRDWNDNRPRGYNALLQLEEALQDSISRLGYQNIVLTSNSGCPGPISVRLNSYTMLLVINSQWWNHKYRKPKPSDAICPYITNQDIADEIDDIIGDHPNHNFVIAAHHPMRSLGNYGGRFNLIDHLTPFPVIGSFINGYRANVGSVYDLKNERLSQFTYLMYNELYFRSNIIYLSGHEKNHQIHKEINNILVNSGALQKGKYSASDYSTILQQNTAGYMRIAYSRTGDVASSFVPLEGATINHDLLQSACIPSQDIEAIDENQSYIPCSTNLDLADQEIKSKTVTVRPGEGYDYGLFTRIWLGKHHRPTWTTPVTVPYLRISENFRNLAPTETGGGRQTLSLKFENELGKRLTFRSVDKEPRKALNYELRRSIVGRIFEDQTSAQHPFGALPVAALLDHIDILHATPKLFVLPNTEALGPFQAKYGGMLGMLEENPGQKDNVGKHFADADDILQSRKLFRKLYDSKDNKVVVGEFVRARLFDILVGDWSKHENNWKWAEYDQDGGHIYRPIPRDRDHAFSKWDGILPWLADREWLLPNTEGFDTKIHGFRSQVFQARSLDRFLLAEAQRDLYLKEAKYIQYQLTDDKIRDAVMTMPKEAFAIEGETIIKKLIVRRDDLQEYALKYFKWLNEDVEILGSAQENYFAVYNEGKVLFVDIYKCQSGKKVGDPIFSRTFDNEVTKLVRVYGLGNEDVYDINIDQILGLDIVLLGGEGSDVYNIQNTTKYIKVIDDKENVEGISIKNIAIEDNWYKQRYTYNRKAKQFDSYLPLLSIDRNDFFGYTLRSATTWTRHRWDKPDYHRRHNLNVSISSEGDYGLEYRGDERHYWGRTDLIWTATIANPDFFDSYYGQGNYSVINEQLDLQDYYVATFNNYGLLGGLRRQFWRRSFLQAQTGFDYFVNKRLENTILANETQLLGANEHLAIVPLSIDMEIDFRDDRTFPRRGNRLTINSYNGMIVNRGNDFFSTIGGTIEQYFSTYNYRPVTIGLKVGGIKGFNDVPFYLQPRLGGNNGLRGYTSNRFFGRSMIYVNSEVRWRILKNDQSAIPYEFGVTAFYDIGQVSSAEDVPNKFHRGYGAGVFLVPFDERFTLSMYLSFSEENTFYPRFTIGTALN